ncbi:MAG: hypothetical protein N7Q72_07220, partial [Spiroplasma sp. Tabriz.8]|nr:hypothetical protein [Spiroplasma sp. Tabriz.8]
FFLCIIYVKIRRKIPCPKLSISTKSLSLSLSLSLSVSLLLQSAEIMGSSALVLSVPFSYNIPNRLKYQTL